VAEYKKVYNYDPDRVWDAFRSEFYIDMANMSAEEFQAKLDEWFSTHRKLSCFNPEMHSGASGEGMEGIKQRAWEDWEEAQGGEEKEEQAELDKEKKEALREATSLEGPVPESEVEELEEAEEYDAESALDDKYAAGEITEEQYDAAKKRLERKMEHAEEAGYEAPGGAAPAPRAPPQRQGPAVEVRGVQAPVEVKDVPEVGVSRERVEQTPNINRPAREVSIGSDNAIAGVSERTEAAVRDSGLSIPRGRRISAPGGQVPERFLTERVERKTGGIFERIRDMITGRFARRRS
jgi:hypothetical protein